MNKVNQHTITTATTTLHSPTGLRTVSGPPLDFLVQDPDTKAPPPTRVCNQIPHKLQFAACLYITNHCCGLGRRRRNFKDAASLYGSLDILLMSGYVRAYACRRVCACETVSPHGSQNTNESWEARCTGELLPLVSQMLFHSL